MLAGLIRDDERKVRDGIPGLSDIPAVGHLFGHSSNERQQTDVILMLTPRIVRVLEITEDDLRAFQMGRDAGAPAPPAAGPAGGIDLPLPPEDAPPPGALPPGAPQPDMQPAPPPGQAQPTKPVFPPVHRRLRHRRTQGNRRRRSKHAFGSASCRGARERSRTQARPSSIAKAATATNSSSLFGGNCRASAGQPHRFGRSTGRVPYHARVRACGRAMGHLARRRRRRAAAALASIGRARISDS